MFNTSKCVENFVSQIEKLHCSYVQKRFTKICHIIYQKYILSRYVYIPYSLINRKQKIKYQKYLVTNINFLEIKKHDYKNYLAQKLKLNKMYRQSKTQGKSE